jgi:hypothetical protein
MGIRGKRSIIPINAPKTDRITASYPWPLINISCPGRIEREVSSSGAPKNIVGIKSMKI